MLELPERWHADYELTSRCLGILEPVVNSKGRNVYKCDECGSEIALQYENPSV